ncbi:MAG: DUF1499 domain-containing protein [Rhodobacteraceae bacterium]|nr:DUF1499 domain-containing protein [Paracoccaceae bacterium]
MRRGIAWLWVGLAIAAVALGYVRLAPSGVADWHVAPPAGETGAVENGVLRMARTGPDGLARFDRIARATPRTRVLAGSVETGMLTYITRSAAIGFPDYTTARQDGDQLVIWARQRFGRSDFGVNRRRVDGWLDALQAR